MGDVTTGGKTVDQRTKVLLIRRRELEVQNLEYQACNAELRADELEVEIIRQHEQAQTNRDKAEAIRQDVARMKGETDG